MITIDPEFKSFIPPLSEGEYADLEASIVAAGKAIVPVDVWHGLIIDGHNRFAVCRKHGLPFTTANHPEIPDRDAAKAWIFQNQITRRNLTPDQIVMLAALRGVETKRGTELARSRAQEMVEAQAEQITHVMSGAWSLALAWGSWARKAGKLAPRPPRGPSGKHAAEPAPNVPEGHELRGQSTLIGPDGDLKGRWDKTGLSPADEPPRPAVPEGFNVRRVSTYVRADGQPGGQWSMAEPEKQAQWEAFWAACERNAANYRGLAEVSLRPTVNDSDLITLYPLGDPHIGMLSWAPETGDHFDIAIATRELLGCVRELVADSPASEQAIICNLGDYLHAQDDSALTPGHGNQLDVDGRFAKVLDAGHALLRGIVDAALVKHVRVSVRNLPGNHDPRVAAELAMWLRAVYERDPRVTVEDAFAAHQYDRFGSNLIGWHHGDRTKSTELPAIMATDRASDWGECTERVWHVGHVHHLTRVETPGCVVETHRTMAGRDAWHAGRYRAGRSLQAITYHRTFGEHVRTTVSLARVRAALEAAA